MIRVALPFHLQTLAACGAEIELDVEAPVTQRTLIDALERNYPMLKGTIREHDSGRRRPRVRFFFGTRDASHDSPDEELPAAISEGRETFRIVGAVAGG